VVLLSVERGIESPHDFKKNAGVSCNEW